MYNPGANEQLEPDIREVIIGDDIKSQIVSAARHAGFTVKATIKELYIERNCSYHILAKEPWSVDFQRIGEVIYRNGALAFLPIADTVPKLNVDVFGLLQL